jgi:serine/threonine-protein kinase HipA
MRQAKVFYQDILAGLLTETNEGDYVFQYEDDYIKEHPEDFITFSMPVSSFSYRDKRLFPFFEGLIPEGWLLDIASKNWKLNRSDRMGLLLACCRNCIGAVSIEPIT